MGLHTLSTQKRHLLLSIRLNDLCKCGCRGWCTLHPLLLSVAWSMKVLVQGQRPTTRHDIALLDDQLCGLRESHGEYLGFTAVALWLNGDWAEASHTLGLPSVASKHAPCPFRGMRLGGLHDRYRSLLFGAREGTMRSGADNASSLYALQLKSIAIACLECCVL